MFAGIYLLMVVMCGVMRATGGDHFEVDARHQVGMCWVPAGNQGKSFRTTFDFRGLMV